MGHVGYDSQSLNILSGQGRSKVNSQTLDTEIRIGDDRTIEDVGYNAIKVAINLVLRSTSDKFKLLNFYIMLINA